MRYRPPHTADHLTQQEDTKAYYKSQTDIDKRLNPDDTAFPDLNRWARSITRTGIDSVLEVTKYPAQRVIGRVWEEASDQRGRLALHRTLFPQAYAQELPITGLTTGEIKALEDAGIPAEARNLAQRILTTNDQNFSVIAIPVPREISISRLKEIVGRLEPLLIRHTRKPLVLAYEGAAPFAEAHDFYETFHERVFLFGHVKDYAQFLEALLKPDRSALKNQRIDRILLELFLSQTQRLYRASGGKANFSQTERLRHAQVLGDRGRFDGLLGQVPRKFFKEMIGPDLEDQLSAEILFNLLTAGQPNAELIRKLVGELLIIAPHDREGERIDLSFNPAKLPALQGLLQAFKILSKVSKAA